MQEVGGGHQLSLEPRSPPTGVCPPRVRHERSKQHPPGAPIHCDPLPTDRWATTPTIWIGCARAVRQWRRTAIRVARMGRPFSSLGASSAAAAAASTASLFARKQQTTRLSECGAAATVAAVSSSPLLLLLSLCVWRNRPHRPRCSQHGAREPTAPAISSGFGKEASRGEARPCAAAHDSAAEKMPRKLVNNAPQPNPMLSPPA